MKTVEFEAPERLIEFSVDFFHYRVGRVDLFLRFECGKTGKSRVCGDSVPVLHCGRKLNRREKCYFLAGPK